MNKYLFTFIFTLFSFLSFSQNNYQDVVYLKNGSIIRGTIIEQVPNQSIKIETSDRSVFVYQMNDIEKIGKEEVPEKSFRKKISDKSNLFFIQPNLTYNYILDLDDAIKYLDLSICIDEGLYLFKNFAVNTTFGVNYYRTPTLTSEHYETYTYYTYINGRRILRTGQRLVKEEIESKSTTSFVYGLGLKYYLASKIPLSMSFISIKHKGIDAVSSLNFMAGYKFCLVNEKVSFEPSIGYVMGLGDNDGYKTVQANFGLMYNF